MDVYFQLIQAVMSNGMGMEAITVKKPSRVSINESTGTSNCNKLAWPVNRLRPAAHPWCRAVI